MSMLMPDTDPAAALTERLVTTAYIDGLTGLGTRRYFEAALEEALRRADRAGRFVAVLTLDLDGFNQVNAAIGWASGNAVLRIVAARVKDEVRSSDIVARIGADEFAIALCGLRTPEDAQRPAQMIIDALMAPLHIDGGILALTTSCGIAIHPDHGQTADRLLENATLAQRKARGRGGRQLAAFDPHLRNEAARDVLMRADLIGAIDREEMRLHLQPQIRLADGALVGAECLVRWQHPTLGLLGPGHFVPQAERTGLIIELGDWVAKAAAQQAVVLAGARPGGLPLSINLSPRQLAAPDCVERLLRMIAEGGAAPSALKLEITESAVIDDMADALAKVEGLRQAGFGIALDDFGTGFSSLAVLDRFPIDTVKIDRSFIVTADGGAEIGRKRRGILGAIVQMAHAIGIDAIAEGIETPAQANMLSALGCPTGQGYLFGRPVPDETFLATWCHTAGQD